MEDDKIIAAMMLSQAGDNVEFLNNVDYLKGGAKQWPYELIDEMGINE